MGDKLKRILCYGDSNTWGTIPDGTRRHCKICEAYPEILQNLLGYEYKVISEGMPSRTTNVDDYKFPKGNRNGALFFSQCLISHDPLDYVIIALGTNDMKSKFNRTVYETADAIEKDYILFTRNFLSDELSKMPKFIIVSPPIINERNLEGFEGASEKSKSFDIIYLSMAKKNNCLYVSNKNLICGDDGVHLTGKSHKLLARTLFEIINNEI